MTIVPPGPGEPRRPSGPRDSGDAWVVAPTGERYWGRYGAAGLLVVESERGVLLQHRVAWSHFGGTWGLPGGALHEGESALVGALREAQEEAGVPDGATRARFTSVLDLGIWSYTTVVVDVLSPFEPVISDPESVALEWVPVDRVADLPLHPGFGAAWPMLRDQLSVRPAVVVDGANVVGSVPDGWWKDRAGAASRLRVQLADLAVPAADLGLDGTVWFPEVALVVEGSARALDEAADQGSTDSSTVTGTIPTSAVDVVRAPAEGDDEIVAEAVRRVADGQKVFVVTSDRELRARIEDAGAHAASVRWLRALFPTED